MTFIRKHLPPTLHNAIGTIIASLLVAGFATVSALSPQVRMILARTWQFTIPLWLLLILAIGLVIALVQITRLVRVRLRHGDVRLYRSLNENERAIITRLAESEYGLTEWEVSEVVPVTTQEFLNFIDRLVTDLHVVERTERRDGGAFWTLSERGRKIAAANGLFPRIEKF